MNCGKAVETQKAATRTLREYRPIEYRQLFAIARVALLADPTLSDGEWKAVVKDVAARQGYDEPSNDLLERTLSAVEHLVERTLGPRPGQSPVSVEASASTLPEPSVGDAHARLADLKHELESRGLPAPGLDRVLAQPARDTTNRTVEQIAAWRHGHGRTQTHQQTASGWEPIERND